MSTEIKGHIIDVILGKVINNCKILIDNNGIITEISNEENCPNQYLLPGLIDTHVHTVLEPDKNYPEFKENEPEKVRWERMKRNVSSSLQAGITTIRDCGHPDNLIYKLREEINKNPKLGSRIICSGRLLTTPGGHARQMGVEVRGVAEIEDTCIKILESGADFIKLINNDPDGFGVEEISKAVEIAHRYGKKVACHIYQPEALHRAIVAGVDTIEHFSKTNKEDIEAILVNKIMVTPTYAGAQDSLKYPEANQIGDENIESSMEEGGFESWIKDLTKGIKMLIEKQIPLATGSDAGFLYTNFQTVLREIPALINLGCSNIAAIQAATINAAKVVGRDKDLGSIEINKYGDVVVYSENPLENIETINAPLAVYKAGIKVNR